MTSLIHIQCNHNICNCLLKVAALCDILCFSEVDIKTRGSMGRMLGIWKERSIFDAEFVNKLKKCFGMISPLRAGTCVIKY